MVNLADKLHELRVNYVFRRMGSEFKYAHEVLHGASWSLRKDKFSEKIRDACLGLCYPEREIKTFLNVAEDVLHVQLIKAPPKRGGKIIGSLSEKLVKILIGSPKEREEEITHLRFLGDRTYYDDVMQRFYHEVIPKLEDRQEKYFTTVE